MPGPWEDFAPTSGPWEDFKAQPPIGIRAATPWESIKSRAQEFLHDPIGTLRAPIPGSEDFKPESSWSQFALGGIAPGGATLAEYAAMPKGKGLAKFTEVPSKLIQAYRNANRTADAASAARVAQASQAEAGGRMPAARVEPSPKPPLDLSPIPGNLSSGRKPGGIANQMPAPVMEQPPTARAIPKAGNAEKDIIKSLGYGNKPYGKLEPHQQAGVDAIMKASLPLPAPTPAPSISQPLGKVSATDSETNLVNTLRGNTTRKNLEIGQYFTGKGMTPEQVASMPEAQFNAHIRNVKNASGNAYQPSTGRNYHRTPEQARAEVVNAMRAMQPMPAPKPPVWPDEPYQPWPQQEPQLTAQ